jgi:hypothetical protein
MIRSKDRQIATGILTERVASNRPELAAAAGRTRVPCLILHPSPPSLGYLHSFSVTLRIRQVGTDRASPRCSPRNLYAESSLFSACTAGQSGRHRCEGQIPPCENHLRFDRRADAATRPRQAAHRRRSYRSFGRKWPRRRCHGAGRPIELGREHRPSQRPERIQRWARTEDVAAHVARKPPTTASVPTPERSLGTQAAPGRSSDGGYRWTHRVSVVGLRSRSGVGPGRHARTS